MTTEIYRPGEKPLIIKSDELKTLHSWGQILGLIRSTIQKALERQGKYDPEKVIEQPGNASDQLLFADHIIPHIFMGMINAQVTRLDGRPYHPWLDGQQENITLTSVNITLKDGATQLIFTSD